MSLIDRAESIHADIKEAKKGAFKLALERFKKQQDEYPDEPTDKQKEVYGKAVTTFTAALVKAEEEQKNRRDMEKAIVTHWKYYQYVINHPKFEEIMSTSPALVRSIESFKTKFTKTEFIVEGDIVSKGKIIKTTAGQIDSTAIKNIWEKLFSADAEKSPNYSYITKTIDSIPTLKIQSNSELASNIDKIQSLLKEEKIDDDQIKELYGKIKGYSESIEPPKCTGCGATNTKLQEGQCAVCVKEEVENMRDDIIERHTQFKEAQSERKKLNPNEIQELKKKKLQIEELREKHDEAYLIWEDSNGKKGYGNYMKLHKALDAALPKEVVKDKKSKRIIVDDEVINSDESEYESDSSSSHEYESKKRGRDDSVVQDILNTFKDLHPGLKKLATTDMSKWADTLKDIQKDMKKFKVSLISRDTGAPFNFPIGQDVFFTRDEADQKEKELCKLLGTNNDLKVKIEEV